MGPARRGRGWIARRRPARAFGRRRRARGEEREEEARPRRAWPLRTGAVTSSASRRRAPSGRERRGEDGEGALPSWRLARERVDSVFAAGGASGKWRPAAPGGALNVQVGWGPEPASRAGERPVPTARFVAEGYFFFRKSGGEFRLDVVGLRIIRGILKMCRLTYHTKCGARKDLRCATDSRRGRDAALDLAARRATSIVGPPGICERSTGGGARTERRLGESTRTWVTRVASRVRRWC